MLSLRTSQINQGWTTCCLLATPDLPPILVNNFIGTQPCLFFSVFKDFIYLFLERGEGKEEERERNMNVWLSLTCPPPGTCPTTQACALTGNRTSNPLICRPALNPLSYISQGNFLIKYVWLLFACQWPIWGVAKGTIKANKAWTIYSRLFKKLFASPCRGNRKGTQHRAEWGN